ncbi:MAG: hypothetical protein WCP28_12705 [Actinomycetes bacterium]
MVTLARPNTGRSSLLLIIIVVGVLALLVAVPTRAWAASWSTPADLSTAGQGAYGPQVTSSADGTKLTAVWYRFNGSDFIIQATTSTNSGTTWSTPTDLTAAGRDALSPQVASSADGTKLTAVWYRVTGTGVVVQAATSTNSGSTWSTPTDLSVTGLNASDPHVVSSTDGTTLTAVWYRLNGTNNIVQTATSTNSGTSWTTPTDLSATGEDAHSPQVASSADGTTLTSVWHRFNGTNNIIQASTSTNTGASWSTPTDLSAAGQSAYDPEITSSADGAKQSVIWQRTNGTNNIVQVATSTNTGTTWTTPTDLSAVGRTALHPRIASSADGSTQTAVWYRFNGTNYIVQAATSTNSGTTWTTPTDLSATGQDNFDPEITSSADGTRQTAIWYRTDGTAGTVQAAASTNSGTTWANPANLSAGGQSITDQHIASSADGTKQIAVWQRSNGTDYIVQAASGITPLPGPLTFSPGNFGTATVGTPTALSVTVTNTGTAAAVPTAITPVGTGVSSTGTGTCAVGTAIAVGGTCTIWLAWTPAAAGALTGASVTIAYNGGAAASNALALTGTASGGTAQTPVGNCVTAGTPRSIPRRGTRTLMKNGCHTNAGQHVGVTFTARQRGDLRFATLYCQVSRTRTAATAATGTGSRYCRAGALKIRTYGFKLMLRITWSAPATGTYNAYRTTGTYLT